MKNCTIKRSQVMSIGKRAPASLNLGKDFFGFSSILKVTFPGTPCRQMQRMLKKGKCRRHEKKQEGKDGQENIILKFKPGWQSLVRGNFCNSSPILPILQ